MRTGALSLALALIAALAGCATTARTVETLPGDTLGSVDVMSRMQRSVVSLVVEHYNGGDAFGAGVVYDDRGTILTAHHVVEDASRIVVLLPEGYTVKATVIASDPVADFALIRMEHLQPGLVAPAAIETAAPRRGDTIWSLGNPFGTSRFGGEVSISRGVISAVSRSYFNDETGRLYLGALQHDAPTNPGNSGGGVFNTQGKLVGINALITTARDVPSDSGVAFALPAASLKLRAEQLLRGERPNHGWLGEESFKQATELFPSGMGRLRTVFGAVAPGGPAAEAGIQAGDVIIKLGEMELFGLNEVLAAEDALRPGTIMAITINRAGNEYILTLAPTERPWRGN
ncbi:MAG: serine protease [Planctomycetes bacterium]|nr:serine protease [Planctomycetota bacterium]